MLKFSTLLSPTGEKRALIIQLNFRRLARAIETSRTKSSAKKLPH